ncbi:MAG: hypothetical protein AAF585_08685, partial [Verrucomicrobiota bacterium]
TERSEIVFTDHVPDATSDLDALRTGFDTDGDNLLTANDAQWSSFGIWQDANADAVSDPGEFQSLDDVGITSISLISDGVVETPTDSIRILGSSTVQHADGSQTVAGDILLAYEELPALDQIVSTGGSVDELLAEGAGEASTPANQAPGNGESYGAAPAAPQGDPNSTVVAAPAPDPPADAPAAEAAPVDVPLAV